MAEIGTKCAILTPKFGYLGPKVNFLFWNRDFCQQSISPVYLGLQLSHSDHSEKNFIFRGTGHLPGLDPVFGHIWQCLIASISTLKFGPWSTKLGGTVRAIKKMTQSDNRPGPGRNYRETASFTFGGKVFFGQKSVFFP